MSFGELSRLPWYESAMIVTEPSCSYRTTRLVRCSQESWRPWKSNVLPLLLFDGLRKTLTRPSSSRQRRSGSGRVDLVISGLPDGLTATFSPSAIAVGQSATLVVRAAPTAAVRQSVPFTVTGTGPGVNGTIRAAVSGTLTVLDDARTALIGRVVDTDRQPLPGVAILVGGQRALTDASGNFLLLDPPTGDQVILIDGDPASQPGRHYPTIPVSMTIVSGRTNELPYLPHLHV